MTHKAHRTPTSSKTGGSGSSNQSPDASPSLGWNQDAASKLPQEQAQGSIFDSLNADGKAKHDSMLERDLQGELGYLWDDKEGMLDDVANFADMFGPITGPSQNLPKSMEVLRRMDDSNLTAARQTLETGNARTLAMEIGAQVYIDWKGDVARDPGAMLEALQHANKKSREEFIADESNLDTLKFSMNPGQFDEAMKLLGTQDSYGKDNKAVEQKSAFDKIGEGFGEAFKTLTGKGSSGEAYENKIGEGATDWSGLWGQIKNLPSLYMEAKPLEQMAKPATMFGLMLETVGIGLYEGAGMGANWLWEKVADPEKAGDVDQVLDQTNEVPPYHVIMEQLAHRYVYEEGGGDPKQIGYENVQTISDPTTGFQCAYYRPTVPELQGVPLKDVVAFRGTDNLQGGLDDSNQMGVGSFQFSMNEANIRAMLTKAQEGGRPDVTGHSLGGALAQRAATTYSGMVDDIITFQSPGLEEGEMGSDFKEKGHDSTHYRREGDWVSGAGEQWTPGKTKVFNHAGWDGGLAHCDYMLAEMNTVRVNAGDDKAIQNLEEDGQRPSHTVSMWEADVDDAGFMEDAWNAISEVQRGGAGNVVSPEKRDTVKVWRDVKQFIEISLLQRDPTTVESEAHHRISEGMNHADLRQHEARLKEQASKLIKQLAPS